MVDNYDELADELELNKDLLSRSQDLLNLLFKKIGISEKPVVSIIYFRKRGSYDISLYKWNREIFQRKIISQKNSEILELGDDKIVPIENYDLPEEKKESTLKLVQDYIDELELLTENDLYFVFHYHYENVNGGTKNNETHYEDDERVEVPPTYSFDDGLITIFSISKDIKKEIKDDTFLKEINNIITRYNFSDNYKNEHIDNLLVKAGMNALNDKIYKSLLPDLQEEDSINLFDLMHNISLLKYESSENHGNILFSSPDIVLENKLILAKPIPLKEFSSAKTIRKLLEISSDDVSLLCDGVSIIGIGKRNSEQDLPKDSFIVEFKGQGEWDVINNKNNRVMSVSNRVPSMPKIAVKKPEFSKRYKETFHSSEYENVWNFIELAKNQPHGTMVVVTKDAENEAKRLSKQSFLISKTNNIPDSIIKGITAIDGAVLLDETGVCHAIGVILDGIANDKIGKISRGARYNSAVRYLNYCKENGIPCLIVIVSEDKYINIKTVHDIEEEE